MCLQIEGSKVLLQEPIVCPVGANFLIKNLFFNIPARRKFLKSNHTELSNIVAEFERIALAHPELSFALSTPDSVLLDLPSGNFRQRIVNIFGRKMDKYLMPVHVETDLVEIIGFVGNPESSKKKGAVEIIALQCSECKRKNYTTTKNRKNIQGKLELSKYCPFDHKHTLHKETKVK